MVSKRLHFGNVVFSQIQDREQGSVVEHWRIDCTQPVTSQEEVLQVSQTRKPEPHEACDVVEVCVEQDKLRGPGQVREGRDMVVTHVKDLQRRHLPQKEDWETCQVVLVQKEELETGQVFEAALKH